MIEEGASRCHITLFVISLSLTLSRTLTRPERKNEYERASRTVRVLFFILVLRFLFGCFEVVVRSDHYEAANLALYI